MTIDPHNHPYIWVGYIRLVVNKWGKLSPHPDGLASTPPAPDLSHVKREENKSAGRYACFEEIAAVGSL